MFLNAQYKLSVWQPRTQGLISAHRQRGVRGWVCGWLLSLSYNGDMWIFFFHLDMSVLSLINAIIWLWLFATIMKGKISFNQERLWQECKTLKNIYEIANIYYPYSSDALPLFVCPSVCRSVCWSVCLSVDCISQTFPFNNSLFL